VGADAAGLLSVDLLGADDVPETSHDVPPGDPASAREPAPLPAPRLPEAGPIAAPQEVSYTALALYDRCAYRFFAERMLRVGSLDIPKPEDPKAFGSTLHAALELVARGESVDVEELARLAAAHGLPASALERLSAARDSVRRSGLEPLIVAGRPETEFAIAVEGGVVRGTMDLVAVDGDSATVLDYKTGLTWDATGARYAAQAEVYALALLDSGAHHVEVRFVHVEAGCEEAVYAFDAVDAQRIRTGIETTLARMSGGEFPSLRAYDFVLCADCPVSGGLCRVVHPHTRTKPTS
jgi:RecB family exonuclease